MRKSTSRERKRKRRLDPQPHHTDRPDSGPEQGKLLQFPGSFPGAEAPGPGPDQPIPPAGISRMVGERMMREVEKLLAEKDFANIEEANEYLATLVGTPLWDDGEPEVSSDPIERAQDLAYEAMESDDDEAEQLAKQALALDPDCVDALVTMSAFAPTPAKRISKLTQAVKAGERRLGKEFFEDNKGYFWGLTETRPYMRARYELAMALIVAGRIKETISHFEALLELSEGDNLGVRDVLVGIYVMADQPEAARDLLERFEDDHSALFSWARALVYYLLRDFDRAKRALSRARRANRYVEKYLTGDKPHPEFPPEFYALGGEDEAAFCGFHLGLAWSTNPMAMLWMTQGGQPGDGKYLGVYSLMKRKRR